MPKMQGHVLTVEDGPELCYFLQTFLHRHNYIVETANNGQEGLKQLETFPAEVILIDFQYQTKGLGIKRRKPSRFFICLVLNTLHTKSKSTPNHRLPRASNEHLHHPT